MWRESEIRAGVGLTHGLVFKAKTLISRDRTIRIQKKWMMKDRRLEMSKRNSKIDEIQRLTSGYGYRITRSAAADTHVEEIREP